MSTEFSVSSYLSCEFQNVADSLVECVIGTPTQDSSAGGQETARYDKLMKSLRLVGVIDAATIFQTVWKWREQSIERIGFVSNSQNREVLIESTFLEAAVQLLENKPYSSEDVLGSCTEKFEHIVFHWAMFADQVQTRFDMMQFRRNIQNTVPRIVGALARGRLEAVSALLFKEITWRERADLSVRQELLSLCDAMKEIQLSFASDTLFSASLNLIQHADPLKHNATQKKSQVRHSLSAMMSRWLHPLAEADNLDMSNLSRDLMDKWYSQIGGMLTKLLNWAEQKNKHYTDGFPLMVDLWCLQRDDAFVASGDKVIKVLKKCLRTTNFRCLAVRLLTQCARAALVRLGRRKLSQDKARLDDWLDKIVMDTIQTIKKGPTPTNELHDLMIRMCVTIGCHRPLFVVENMILPLLQNEQLDKYTIALRSVLEMMFVSVAKLSKPNDGYTLRDTMVSLETNSLELDLLEFIRGGNSALDLLRLADRQGGLSREIAKLLNAFDSTSGVGPSGHRGSMSDNAKDSSTGLNVMAWTLRCIPYILPDDKRMQGLIDMLARYTSHQDVGISTVAFRSLKNILVGMPETRNDVVRGVANCVMNIPEYNRTGIVDGLRNLETLLMDWQSMADNADDTNASDTGFASAPLEGAALCFLCSDDANIRKMAFDMLGSIRALSKALGKAQNGGDGLEHDTSVNDLGYPSSNLDPGQEVQENPFLSAIYVMDVLEEMGCDIAHRVYWDFGPHSDLHRRWKQVPETITLSDVLFKTSQGNSNAIRLARCLSEIVIEAHGLCRKAFEHGYILITKKFGQLSRGDSSRPGSFVDITENISIDQFRNYCCLVASCPPYTNKDRIARGAFSAVKLVQLLLSLLIYGSPLQQNIAVMSLGGCNPEVYDILATEIQPLLTQEQSRDRSRGKQTTKSKMEEIRLNTANIFRIISDQMPRGTLRLRKGIRKRLLEFIERTLIYIRHLGPGSLFESITNMPSEYSPQDVLQLCICLCAVTANAGAELISTAGQDGLNVELRRLFFNTLQKWNSPGVDSADCTGHKYTMKQTVIARLKDPESYDRVEAELEGLCCYLEVASRLAMVAVLQGPHWEDRRTNNPIFVWVDHLLIHANRHNTIGPSNITIARQALTKLIISNMTLFDSYVNKCYNGNKEVSSVYFQVVCEVYSSYEVHIAVHVILSLVLYKCVDDNPEVREDALHLLKCLSYREWGGKCTTGWAMWSNGHSIEDDAIVIGRLQDTCQMFQYQLSESLAREHPEVNEKLCEELITMQCNEVVHQGVFLCLTPWMEQLSFSPEDSEWGDRLLKSMYFVTQQHGKEFSYEIERLWTTIASKGNIRPILSFLVDFAMKECSLQDTELLSQYYSVFKRISVYLARTSPHRTIDHLVCEAAQMMHTPALLAMEGENSTLSTPLRFSNSPSSSGVNRKREGSASSQVEMTRSAESGTGGGSRPRPPSFTMTPMHRRDPTYASNVSMSMQSDGSYEEIMKSEMVQNSKASMSNLSALGGGRGSEVVAPMLKGLLQRADVAICLLAEIAYEKGDEFSDHVPLLFHLCVVCMDSLEPIVRLHCQHLVINLLNVLLAKRVGVPSKANKLSALVSALQSMKGQSPWPYEDTNLSEGHVLSEAAVNFFVAGLLEAASDGSNLKDLWIKEALTWAVESSSRHLSCRSFQVLRGLTPMASSEAFISLVRCLKACFMQPSLTAMECVLEILETMKMLMNNAEASKKVLYPQLFWVCISLLSSDYVHIYRLALELLQCLLESLKITNDTILNVLLATTPTSIRYSPVLSSSMGVIHEEESANRVQTKEIQSWDLGTQILLPQSAKNRSVLCIQHLLIKGLHLVPTEPVTIRLLSLLAAELVFTPEMSLDSSSYLDDLRPKTGEHSAVSVLLGSVNVQIGVSLGAVVYWTCQKILGELPMNGAYEVCTALAEACISERCNMVGTALVDLTNADVGSLSLGLTRLADALIDELPGQVQSLIIGYWMGLLKKKEQGMAQIGLMLLRAVFDRCKSSNASESTNWSALRVVSSFNVFSLVASHLQGSNSIEASEVLSAMVACSVISRQRECMDQEETVILSEALEMGMDLHQLIPSDKEHVKNTINGVLETCPHHLKKPSGREYMPFLKEHHS